VVYHGLVHFWLLHLVLVVRWVMHRGHSFESFGRWELLWGLIRIVVELIVLQIIQRHLAACEPNVRLRVLMAPHEIGVKSALVLGHIFHLSVVLEVLHRWESTRNLLLPRLLLADEIVVEVINIPRSEVPGYRHFFLNNRLMPTGDRGVLIV